ncbi:MAG TPA: anti-sigma factor [Burkholderiaceae bacterium]|nr:anti-sigma factor [Burkholderiaceae bacterium]
MRLARQRQLDALCGEYLVGTLHGRPRRRFERALRQEPLVAARLAYWQRTYTPRPSDKMRVQPGPETWRRLETELGLVRYKRPWWRRVGLWRLWATAATAALVVVIGIQVQRFEGPRQLVEIARLGTKEQPAAVIASISGDREFLQLSAARPIEAGPTQSYELWLIPNEGGAPVSLAVLGQLDARLIVPAKHRGRLRAGATLAVSVEPAGGSPTGAPTGPVILTGTVES